VKDEWLPDILGKHFEQRTISLGADDEGDVVATLVRYTKRLPLRGRRASVLYVHGWSDYFYQRHVAEFWRSRGVQFYALDLRKYGRSLRDGQTPGYVSDLATYDAEIGAAIEIIGRDRPLILFGHSTGGLTVSLWASRNPGIASALVLNSPWLEFQGRRIGRAAIAPVVNLQARYRPNDQLPVVDLGFYSRTISARLEGEWDYDERLRPLHGFPIHPAWLTAILAGHARVEAGLDIDIPVLVLLSTRSLLSTRWSPAMREADTAIDVEGVARASLRLGSTVTIVRVRDALHDVFLSPRPIREHAFADVARWLRAYGHGARSTRSPGSGH
jgi:alpha-beta hydrolase superfamily lysophospholipase